MGPRSEQWRLFHFADVHGRRAAVEEVAMGLIFGEVGKRAFDGDERLTPVFVNAGHRGEELFCVGVLGMAKEIVDGG